MNNFRNDSIDLEHKDKFIHATFYFGFTTLWYLSLKKGGNNAKTRLGVFAFAVGFGIVIELFQQFFTADRSADVQDAVANTVGSAIAILVLWLFEKFNKK